ncbi:hypothetical protein CL653_00060 [bacterium]|nr:hypothetical protein [bacterium]
MSFQNDSIFWVEVEKIVPNPYQPRREFDDARLKELSESIRMYGVLQPLTVCRKEVQLESGAFRTEYELVAGERRLRASKLAGLGQVPVLIREGEDSEQEKLELAIIENLQREDLNAVDRALAFRQLADVFSLSHTQVAKKVGRSREYVSNTIRLLNLPDYMLQSVREGDITEGHARALLMLNDKPEEQDTIYREILLKKLSVRQVELLARKVAVEKVRKKQWEKTNAGLIEKERALTETLGTRVQIAKTDYGGKITIDYFSEDDLDKLLVLLRDKQNQSGLVGQAEEMEEVVQAIKDSVPVEETKSEDTKKALPVVEGNSNKNEKSEPEEQENIAQNEIETEKVVQDSSTKENRPVSNLRDKLSRLFSDKEEAKTAFSEMPEPAQPHSNEDFAGKSPITQEKFVKEEEIKKKDDDDEIYDLKNFSI